MNAAPQTIFQECVAAASNVPKVYTHAELIEICKSNPHPEVRAIAGDLLYSMGKCDQAAATVASLS
jgi:hypothetical protein